MTVAQPPRKLVLVFFGLIASGKSYLASSWARQHGCPYINTDVVRKQLAGLDPYARRNEQSDSGIYTGDWTNRTYAAMRTMALQVLQDLQVGSVVLDGSFRQRCERSNIVDGFAELAQVAFIYCCCSEATTKQRLARRAVDPTAVSDGRWEIFVKQRELFEPPAELDGNSLLILNTEASLADLHAEIAAFLHMV